MIPHNNLHWESLFSTIRNTCTGGLYSLGKNATQGYASTSAYTETTSVRNNHFGILIRKTNMLGKKKLACYEWESAKSVFPQAKSAISKNLQARK